MAFSNSQVGYYNVPEKKHTLWLQLKISLMLPKFSASISPKSHQRLRPQALKGALVPSPRTLCLQETVATVTSWNLQATLLLLQRPPLEGVHRPVLESFTVLDSKHQGLNHMYVEICHCMTKCKYTQHHFQPHLLHPSSLTGLYSPGSWSGIWMKFKG